MTREEAIKFLTDTKVYVKDKSREIQAKLFSLGFKWNCSECREIHNTDKPFLFMYGSDSKFFITYSTDVEWFKSHPSKEITPEDILNITVDKPKYRPFKDVKECWQEMLKHQPFGWVTSIRVSYNVYDIISYVCKRDFPVFGRIQFADETNYNFADAFQLITFADGTPFGIKED